MPSGESLSHFTVQTCVYQLKGAEADMSQVECHSSSFYSRGNGMHVCGWRPAGPLALGKERQEISPLVTQPDWTVPCD